MPRLAHLIGAETLARLNDRVVASAWVLQVARGAQAVGGQHGGRNEPTPSRLISDGVRLLSRLLRRAMRALAGCARVGRAVFRRRMRSLRHLVSRSIRTVLLGGGITIRKVRLASSRPKTAFEDHPHGLSSRQHRSYLDRMASALRTALLPRSISSFKTLSIAPHGLCRIIIRGFPDISANF